MSRRPAHPKSPRDHALDAFRGLTVLLMILVNVQGSGEAAFPLLKHAEWNGLTLADLVFPWFLLIVGLSTPLAIDGRHAGTWRIVRRSALLFAIGVALALMIRPRFDPDQIRWMGVLQRIGIVYLACALLAKWTRGWRVPAMVAVACLIVHTLVLLSPAPGQATPSLLAGEGMAGWLDRLLLPGRIYRTTWDPEGALSTLSAIGNALIGVATTRWLRDGRGGNARLGALAVALAVFGLAAALVVPLHKALWTASFALVTAGLGLGLWLVLRLAWPRIAGSAPGRLLLLSGQTALTLYVVHTLLIVVIVRKLPDGRRLWDMLYDALAGTGLSPPVASLLFALIATALSLAAIPPLKRRGWVLRV